MDRLESKNSHEITDEEIENSIQSFWKKECPNGDHKIVISSMKDLITVIDYIGIISWGLYHGCTIGKEHLRKALNGLTSITNPAYITWKGKAGRQQRKALRIEMKSIKKAYEGEGRIEKKHTPGLLDSFAGEPMLVED